MTAQWHARLLRLQYRVPICFRWDDRNDDERVRACVLVV
jgi:hypothetical protein